MSRAKVIRLSFCMLASGGYKFLMEVRIQRRGTGKGGGGEGVLACYL